MKWRGRINWRKARRIRKLEDIGATAAHLVLKLLDVNGTVKPEDLDRIAQAFDLEIRRLVPEAEGL